MMRKAADVAPVRRNQLGSVATMRRIQTIWTVLLALLPFAPVRAAEAPHSAVVERKVIQASIDAGLRWLAEHQIREGPRAGAWDTPQYPTAFASFAGLAFLANGHLPGRGEYGAVVDRAMRYVQGSMAPDGYLGEQGDSMYVHAICTLFGLSYLGMTGDDRRDAELAEWCRRSLKVVVAAQAMRKPEGERGGWRYSPQSAESDLSVTSWQIMVLHAARQCGFEVEDRVLDDAMRYVAGAYAAVDDVGGFVYRTPITREPEPGVTGAAVLVKSVIEREPDEKRLKAERYLARFTPAWGGAQYKGYFYFVSFYTAQGAFQAGDNAWLAYAAPLERLLLDHQRGDGSWEYPPDNRVQSAQGGYVYSTAMAVLLLSLDRQYLPMYQRQAALYR